jgi:tRNA nucleotidyltransferase (CCA-adding enzyme)
MKVIVSHASPDFDALASIALCKLIHPGATAVIAGGLNSQLTAFLHLYKDILDTYAPDDIALDAVEELIVVDTSDAERIAPFDQLIGRVPITLYDHHPRPENAITASRGIQRPLGATTTILTLMLKSEGVTIPQALASLALLGIHEDTGHFSYALTTAEDHEAAAYLLRCGANSELVRRYSGESYAPEHRDILGVMVSEAERCELAGRTVIISAFSYPHYVSGLAPLVNQLMNLYNADAAIAIVQMDDKTFVVGRSNSTVNIGKLLQDCFGGGGHISAGFARTTEPLAAVKTALTQALPDYLTPLRTAADIMSFPVRTVSEDSSIEAASVLLSQYGHNGLPVENAQGQLVGIVTRRNIDKALRHGLASAPVRAIMVKKIITAPPDTPLDRLEQLMQTHNVGRIPIVITVDGATQLRGIVTRSDLIRARHQNGKTAQRPLLEQLPYAASDFLAQAQRHIGDASLYLVGGVVRDLLLGIGMTDLDLLVEGTSAQQFAGKLQRRLGGELSCHLDFGTCTLRLPNQLAVDIATAREEFYAYPGALPTVSDSTVYKDLARRDFTINAMALRLHPDPQTLIDPFGGEEDLNRRLLRTLHPLSFTEDPTRMLRGARLAARLKLSWEAATLEQLRAALDATLRVSHSRLRAELELTLTERYVAPAIGELVAQQILPKLYGISTVMLELFSQLDQHKLEREIPLESYLLALFLPLSDAEFQRLLTTFHWPKRHTEARQRLRAIQQKGHATEQDLSRASAAELELARALSPSLAQDINHYETLRNQPRLKGQDVLDLGLSPGPLVGTILREVAEARRQNRVRSYDEELALAKDLIQELQESR